MTAFYRQGRFWLAALVVVGGLILFCHWPVDYPLHIAPETTYLDGPLNEFGLVNYVAAINDMAGTGADESNNAAGPLLQATEPGAKTGLILKALGLAGQGETPFVPYDAYVKQHGTPEPDKGLFDQMDQAVKGPWSAQQYPLIAAWIEANEKPLSLAKAASSRSRYFIPLVSGSDPPLMMDTTPTYLVGFHDLAKALVARAMMHLEGGSVEQALDDLMAVHRLARLICQSAMLNDRVLALTLEACACYGDRAVVCSGALGSRQAKAALEHLDALTPLPDFSLVFGEGERLRALDFASMLSCGRQPASMEGAESAPGADGGYLKSFNWNVILSTLNTYYDRIQAAFDHEGRVAIREALEAVDQEVAEKADRMKGVKPWRLFLMKLGGRPFHQAMTRVMTDLMVISLVMPAATLSDFTHAIRMRFDLARTAYALAAYRQDRGEYPSALAALAPEYMAKVPGDVFSGQSLGYEMRDDGFLLYSVGPDGKDDGGLDEGETLEGDLAVSTD